jgi:hypothetical protein
VLLRPHYELKATPFIRQLSTGTPHGILHSPRDGRDATAAFVGVSTFAGELAGGLIQKKEVRSFQAQPAAAPGKSRQNAPTRAWLKHRIPAQTMDGIFSFPDSLREMPGSPYA